MFYPILKRDTDHAEQQKGNQGSDSYIISVFGGAYGQKEQEIILEVSRQIRCVTIDPIFAQAQIKISANHNASFGIKEKQVNWDVFLTIWQCILIAI